MKMIPDEEHKIGHNIRLAECATESLIARTRNGDTLAFDEIVGRFQNRTVGYAYFLLGDGSAAEDAAQDAFLQAYRELPSLRIPAAFPVWLRALVFKQAHRVLRQRKLHFVTSEVADIQAVTLKPYRDEEIEETQEQLQRALAVLSPGERSVLLLHYLGQHRQKEIGEFLGLPASTVRKRIERARTRLKANMRQQMEQTLQAMTPTRNKRFVEMAQLLRRIVDVLEANPVVVAAYLASFGADGEGLDTHDDGWNSLNLHVVVENTAMDSLATERRGWVERIASPLLTEEADQNAPPLGYYLMAIYDGEAGPYEVDWYWHGRDGMVIPTETRLLFDRAGLPQGTNPTQWGYLIEEQIPAALRTVKANRTPEQCRAEEGRNIVSLFWAMLMIAAKGVARQPNAATLGFGGMLQNLCRDARALLGDKEAIGAPNLPDPALITPSEKLEWLRKAGETMEGIMPRLAEAGADLPHQAPAAAYRFVGVVEESLDPSRLG